MICMKKILAISSALLMITAVFTGCGADRNNESEDGSYFESHDYGRDDRTDSGSSAKDRMDDAVDGVKDAGEDIIGGVTDAADDIMDGLDGDTDRNTRTSTSTSSRTTAD